MANVVKNNEVRKRLDEWREANFNPSIVSISKHIDVSYKYLQQWKAGRFEMGDVSLRKVEKFINANGINN